MQYIYIYLLHIYNLCIYIWTACASFGANDLELNYSYKQLSTTSHSMRMTTIRKWPLPSHKRCKTHTINHQAAQQLSITLVGWFKAWIVTVIHYMPPVLCPSRETVFTSWVRNRYRCNNKWTPCKYDNNCYNNYCYIVLHSTSSRASPTPLLPSFPRLHNWLWSIPPVQEDAIVMPKTKLACSTNTLLCWKGCLVGG